MRKWRTTGEMKSSCTLSFSAQSTGTVLFTTSTATSLGSMPFAGTKGLSMVVRVEAGGALVCAAAGNAARAVRTNEARKGRIRRGSLLGRGDLCCVAGALRNGFVEGSENFGLVDFLRQGAEFEPCEETPKPW